MASRSFLVLWEAGRLHVSALPSLHCCLSSSDGARLDIHAAKSMFVIGGGSCFSAILPSLLIFASSELSSAPTSMANPVQ